MNKTIPLGISVIYFDDQSKRLSKRIYKHAMAALVSREQSSHRSNCLPYSL